MDILRAIYNGEYNTAYLSSKEYRAVLRKNADLVEALLSSLDPEDIDRLNASYADMADIENYESFLAGLRLGIAVMWEYCQ